MDLSKEQLEDLKQYEYHFHLALKRNRARAISTHEQKYLLSLLKIIKDDNVKGDLRIGCSTCLLNIFKQLGEYYNKAIELPEKKLKKSKDIPEDIGELDDGNKEKQS